MPISPPISCSNPAPRNTAAAVALAALYAPRSLGWRGARQQVCPSDHLITDPEPLRAAVGAGAAARAAIVTFGIEPTRPETGYGYIAQGDALDYPGVHGRC
ncbi:MAG: sugar phosphate nucleotidyltransferase [Geminicoccaceae bacterium]